MLNTVKDVMHTIGDSTGDFAKFVGSGTADLAKLIGPKRAIIGAVVIGAAVAGSILLVRYLRARKDELPLEGADEQMSGRRSRRHNKRGAEAQFQH
jgi:hypothetical protein